MDATHAPGVLIIEDHPLVARSLKLMLRSFRPVLVHTLDELRAELPTLPSKLVVLSDLNLEDDGGDEIYALFCAERPDLLRRLFWLTGGGRSLERYRAVIDASERPVVLKPVAPLELRALVEGALEADEDEDS